MTEIEDAFRVLVRGFATQAPLPAGGSAGVVSLAMGVALATKVFHLSPALTEGHEAYTRLETLLQRLMPEFANDAAAFAGLLAAFKRPPADNQRQAAIRAAWHSATKAPVVVANLAAEAEAILFSCRSSVKASVAGDMSAAIDLVQVGRSIAERNALENAGQLDPQVARQLLDTLPPKRMPEGEP